MIKKIGVISDTHSYWDSSFEKYFSICDEIWHAGDIGNLEITDRLKNIAPLKGVYGNIDNNEIRTIIDKDSMECTFVVYNGVDYAQEDNDEVNRFTVDCFQENDSMFFDYFEDTYNIDFD